MEDLTAASLDDVVEFFSTYYAPDNAVLSIAGDADIVEVRRIVEEYFGAIPRGGPRPPLPPMQVPLRFGSPRREVVEDDVRLPRLYLAFRVPPFGTELAYTAGVCAAVLGLKRGSRLHRALVRERQVAAEVTAFTFDLSKGSDLLIVDVTARPAVTAERIESEVAFEIDRLQRDGVTPGEIERALAVIETDFTVSLQSAADRADKLSQFATYFGDPGLLNTHLERYQTVTAERVSRFAAEWLGRDNRASLVYVPRDPAVDAGELAEAVTAGA
jgi:predicted Zn-dependent peptidase